MKIIETKRCILRPWRLSDVEDMYDYAKLPNVGPAAGWRPHQDTHESARIIAMFISSNEVWAIEMKDSKKVVGSIGLHMDDKRPKVKARMVGFVLHPAYWGQSIIAESVTELVRYAFSELEVDVISGYHYPFNRQSGRVFEKCGFRYEGTLRMSSVIYDGTVLDNVCYSILRSECSL